MPDTGLMTYQFRIHDKCSFFDTSARSIWPSRTCALLVEGDSQYCPRHRFLVTTFGLSRAMKLETEEVEVDHA